MTNEHEQLIEKCKDCAVFYGLGSLEYAEAINKLNEYLLSEEQKSYDALTFFQKLSFNRKYNKKWHKIHKNS